MHPTALSCAAFLGFMLFGLGMFVSANRFRQNRLLGTPDDPTNLLTKAVRAHANTAEFAPLLVVLILYLGAHQPADWVVGCMLGATLCRGLIVAGILFWPSLERPNPARFLGGLGTYLFGLALCAALLLSA